MRELICRGQEKVVIQNVNAPLEAYELEMESLDNESKMVKRSVNFQNSFGQKRK